MERDCQHGLYKAGMGSSRVLSDFAEKYGSKNRVLAGFGIGGKSGKEKVYKLGCDRESVDERAALANLIANLTLDTEENKTYLKKSESDSLVLYADPYDTLICKTDFARGDETITLEKGV
ncbi:hypothetical protein Tco_0725248 [Tanacetum coccineum]|uniref:Uncharacterized protein n=1 Tax=Tanacetum coccineum TaxID=301880 RepID=A0ABQ4YEG2_9ASTR